MPHPIKNVEENEIKMNLDAVEDVPTDVSRKVRVQSRINNRISDRPQINFQIGSRFNISEETQERDPDNQHGFVVYSCNGEDSRGTYESAVENAWVPDLRSEDPTYKRAHVRGLFASDREDDFIKIGGQIRMKRPKEVHEAENKFYQDQNKEHQEYRKKMTMNSNGGFDQSTHRSMPRNY